MKKILLILVLLPFAGAGQEPVPEMLDYFFKPTTSIPRYVATKEQKEGAWLRQIYYYPEKTLARSTIYRDSSLKTAHGEYRSYHMNGYLKETGSFVNGKKEGPWLEYSQKGFLSDSTNYHENRRIGISLGFHESGYLSDSTNFDSSGNGVEVRWRDDGTPSAAGRWVSDTLKDKRWVYFFPNGQKQAVEEYVHGKKIQTLCYDENGQVLEGSCDGYEAKFSEQETAWRKYLEKNLNPNVPVRSGAPEGIYTIAVRFQVTINGELKDLVPLTRYGFGMEEEVIRILKKSPKWVPAKQFGRNVNAYRIQPVTFQVTSQ